MNSMNSANFDSARRQFLMRSSTGVFAAALASLCSQEPLGAEPRANPIDTDATSTVGCHFAPRAKRMIYLFQSGGPAHQDLFDYKPLLNAQHGQQLPESIRRGQRLTGMSANQASIPLAGSAFKFRQHGQSRAWICDALPQTSAIADELCFVKSMYTEAINHDPAITFFQTGSQIAGRPSLGSWLAYGLGSMNDNLPTFVVLVTAGQGDQPLYSRLWGNGFLDSRYQGIRFRSGKDAVLFLSNPEGTDAVARREMLDKLATLNQLQMTHEMDPEIESRMAQYELAFRMQTSVPEVTRIEEEPESTFRLYGEDARQPGTYAYNCLLARRLAERGVRFVQLYHQGWDHHGGLPAGVRQQAQLTDKASAALVLDLKQRGMLDDTLVVWGGEFGRTSYCQGKMTADDYGRDHHPRCFTVWMAGGGVRRGMTYGRTDDYGYNIAHEDGTPMNPTRGTWTPGAVHVHDLQATLLHLLGMDHERLTFKFQGRRFRLTDVHGHVVREVLA